MSYPIIYRKRVIEYRQKGNKLKETSKVFKIAVSTIQRWEKQLKEKGDLENKALNRPFKKINPEKLKEYIRNHPDTYIKEMAETFNYSTTAIIKYLNVQKLRKKKDSVFIKNKSFTSQLAAADAGIE